MRNLTLERVRAHLTVKELADRAGVDRRTIHRIEEGHGRGSDLTLWELSRALGWPEGRFRERADEVSQPDAAEV